MSPTDLKPVSATNIINLQRSTNVFSGCRGTNVLNNQYFTRFHRKNSDDAIAFRAV